LRRIKNPDKEEKVRKMCYTYYTSRELGIREIKNGSR
jgi:hypothetical protein